MKMDRLISIIMLLLERQKMSVAELARICEVTPRTISRDLETINQAGIPIVSYMGSRGGVGIMENYKLEKRLFSTADVTALLMGLGCIHSSLSGQEIVNALAKVKGLIPEEQRRDIELRAGRLTIDMTPWGKNAGQADSIETIQQAMERNVLLQFDYTDRTGRKSSRTVEPYRLLLKGMCWYLEAYCLRRQDFRLFKLSRMADLTMQEAHFIEREYHPAPMIQPVFQDENVVTATLRVRTKAIEYLEDTYGVDVLQKGDGEWTTAQISLSDDERGYRFLLGLGADCVCIAPESVRCGLKNYLADMMKRYQLEEK